MKELIRFIKFNIIGVLNTLVDTSIFLLLAELIGVRWQVAQVISYSIGVINSYILNKKFTFASIEKHNVTEFSRFIVVNLFSLGISLAIINLIVENMHGTFLIAKLFSLVITTLINYFGNKMWTFAIE